MERDVKVEVELVDPDGAGDGAPASTLGDRHPADRAGHRSGRSRRRWWPFVAVVAVAIGALVVTQGVLDARERARIERYAEVVGVLPLVDEAIEVLWTFDERAVTLAYAGGPVDDRLVGAWFEPSGAQSAVALDARTGEVAWSTPLAPAEELMAVAEHPWVSCVIDTGAPDPVLTCLVLTAHTPGPGREPPVAGAAELVTLDARTGEVLHREPSRVDAALAAPDGVVVTAWPEADGGVSVRALDPRTGTERWRFSAPAEQVGVATQGEPPAQLSGRPGADTVLLQGPETAWSLSADGELLATIRPDTATAVEGWYVAPLRSGDLAVQVFAAGDMTTTLLSPSGTELLTQPGTFVAPFPDDGSVPHALFVEAQNGAPEVWDRATGKPLWTTLDLGHGAGLVLDGTYYGHGYSSTLVAIDLASGRTLWQAGPGSAARTQELLGGSVLTDGRAVLAVVPSADGASGASEASGATIEAYARSDGAHLWTAELPRGIASAGWAGGILVGWSQDGERQVALG